MQWWGLCGQMMLRAMLGKVLLLVGPPMPEMLKVMTQTKRGTLVLQVGRWAWSYHPHPTQHKYYETSTNVLEIESNGYEYWLQNLDLEHGMLEQRSDQDR